MTTPMALPYVGLTNSDANLVPKNYVDTLNTSLAVTTNYVSTQLTNYLANNPQVLQSYVDAQNALVAKKADVLAANTTAIPVTQSGAALGIATLDGTGVLPSAQLPTTGLLTDRVTKCYSVGIPTALTNILGGTAPTVSGATGTLLFSQPHTSTTTSNYDFQLCSVVIPDPGYAWRPLPYGWIQGNASGATKPATRMSGTNNFGKLLVVPPQSVGTTVYGMALCGSSYYTNSYPIFPYANGNQTPTSVPAITGSLELDVWASCLTGTSYTFLPTNFVFYVLQVPAI